MTDSADLNDPDLPGPDAWGVHEHWTDAGDEPRRVPAETLERLREAIGTPPDDLEERAPVVTRPGRDLVAVLGAGPWRVRCEDGTERTVGGPRLPEDFPLGYHDLLLEGGRRRRLIVSPGRCWLPEGWRAWGLTVQLYAARSSDSWGIGDLGDLRTLRDWAEHRGAGFLLVNPLHAVGPTLPQEPSPYLPATRRFRNPLYLRVAEVPGAGDLGRYVDEATAANRTELVDRDRVWRLKEAALREIHAAGPADADRFAQWREQQGEALEEFATWSALAREHGPDWHAWPGELRRPDTDAVAAYRQQAADEIGFHAWLQWLLDEQLAAASGGLTVIQDLPIGVSGGGADAWAWQHVLAPAASVGAPPDLFNTEGQDWGSPPMTPWRLRLADYEPFVQSIRATIAGAGGLRIDHVMGLFRLWWVPAGCSPADGAYVRYPSEDLLDIVALESHRAEALVVGEDLGTVEPGVREALAERNLLSYRLLWFEDDDPAQWPEPALAAVTTHDLPTVAGLWTGADVKEQLRWTGISPRDAEQGRDQLLARLMRDGRLLEDATPQAAVLEAHRLLARAPSVLVSATLEDAVADERRPNLPGVVDRPNWSLPLPVLVDDLPEHPGLERLAQTLEKRSTRGTR